MNKLELKIKNELLDAIKRWEILDSFSTSFIRCTGTSPEHLSMPVDEITKSLYRLYHQTFGLVPLNPSKSERVDYITQAMTKGNIYNRIDTYFKESLKKPDEDYSAIIFGNKGNGKTTSQNIWLSEHMVQLENRLEYRHIVVRCDIHKILYIPIQLRQDINEITIKSYIVYQLAYIAIKYGLGLCGCEKNLLFESLLKEIGNHTCRSPGFPTFANGQSYCYTDIIHEALAKSIEQEAKLDKEEASRGNDHTRPTRPYLRIIHDLYFGPNKGNHLLKKQIRTWGKLGMALLEAMQKNSIRLFVIIDGIDNLSWEHMQTAITRINGEPNSKNQNNVYSYIIDQMKNILRNPSEGMPVKVTCFTFCRPETLEHLLPKPDIEFGQDGRLKKNIRWDEQLPQEEYTYSEIINKKIGFFSDMLDPGQNKLANKPHYLSHVYKQLQDIISELIQNKNENPLDSNNEDDYSPDNLKKIHNIFTLIEWHRVILKLLASIDPGPGEPRYTLEDLSSGDMRSLTYNAIRASIYLSTTHKPLVKQLLSDERTFLFAADKDTELDRQIRDNLLFIEHEKYSSAAFSALIPSLFAYSLELFEKDKRPYQRLRWGGLLVTRIFQHLKSDARGYTRSETILTISKYFDINADTVSHCFNYLLSFGMIAPTKESIQSAPLDPNNHDFRYAPKKKFYIAFKLLKDYADIAMLMAAGSSILENQFSFHRDRHGHIENFLTTMVIGYVSTVKNFVIQNTIDNKMLEPNIRKYLQSISDTGLSQNEIDFTLQTYHLDVNTILSDRAISALAGALIRMKELGTGETRYQLDKTLQELKNLGLDIDIALVNRTE